MDLNGFFLGGGPVSLKLVVFASRIGNCLISLTVLLIVCSTRRGAKLNYIGIL
jgi:hypothetical protein